MDAIRAFWVAAPWPLRAALWAVSWLVLWTIASIPANLILAPIRAARDFLLRWTRAQWNVFAERRRGDRAEIDRAADALVETERISVVYEGWLDRWKAMAAEGLKPVELVLGSITNALHDLTTLDSRSGVHGDGDSFTQLAAGPKTSPAEGVGQIVRWRVALVLLPIFSAVLIGLIMVNSGILGQIIRELNFVPPGSQLLGIPSFRLFAIFLTAIETSTGLVFGWLGVKNAPAPGLPRRTSIGRVLIVFAAIGFGTVEGYFYSQIGSGSPSDQLTLFQGFTLSSRQIFFGWGFLLVMGLFALGDAWFETVETVLSGTAARSYRREVARGRLNAERLRADVKSLADASATLQRAIADIHSDMKLDGGLNAIEASVERLRQDFRQFINQPPDWLAAQQTPIVNSAVLRSRIAVWVALSAVIFAVCGTAFFLTIGSLFPYTAPPSRIAVAVGLGLLFFVLGLLTPSGQRYVRDRGGSLVPLFPTTSMRLRLAIGGSLLGLTFVAAVWQSSDTVATFLRLLITGLIGFGLLFAGREVAQGLPFVALLLRRVVLLTLYCFWFLWCISVSMVAGVAAIFAWLVELVAQPTKRFFVSSARDRVTDVAIS